MSGPGERMGLAFVPGTFPTYGVSTRMKKAGVDVGFGVVDQLYSAYYLALKEEGLQAYNPGAGGKNSGPLLTSLSRRTGQPRNTVAAWLNALYAEVSDNGRDYYLDPVTADKAAEGQVDVLNHPLSSIQTVAKSIGDSAGSLVKPSADALTNVIKYTAMAVAAAAVIYGIYHGTKIFKARKRKKRG